MAKWNERRRVMEHVRSGTEGPALQDVKEPNLMRSIFPYDQVPIIDFDHQFMTPEPPARMLLSDTTFRDGQQARPPYTDTQIAHIYSLLSKLSGPRGIIRQAEFFLYSEKDRRSVEFCREQDRRFPEITGWIRADTKDVALVKEMGLKETGILTSVSDYHIFLKLGLTRQKALDMYLGVVKEALSAGIVPRCHFEDMTRADIYGFCVPFAIKLMELHQESGLDIKIRICDTMGYGVSYPGAALPRSVPKLVRALIDDAGVPGQLLEWHGHNDFHKALANAATAWLYGCGTVNSTLFGFGERTGNAPLEGMIMEYIALNGNAGSMKTRVITELAYYFQEELGHKIPANYPFVGADFNATSAGVHADGLIKNEEIYNIFDTKSILNRPISIIISDKSGTAGIAYWINDRLRLKGQSRIDKRHPCVVKIHKEIMAEYAKGRTTNMSSKEMERLARRYMPDYFYSEFDVLKQRAAEIAVHLVEEIIGNEAIVSLDPQRQEPVLRAFLEQNPFIQYVYLIDTDGKKILNQAFQLVDRSYFQEVVVDDDFTDRSWFQEPMADGQVHVSDFYTSRYTRRLCITVSGPIHNKDDEIIAILGADVRFEDLAKMEENGKE